MEKRCPKVRKEKSDKLGDTNSLSALTPESSSSEPSHVSSAIARSLEAILIISSSIASSSSTCSWAPFSRSSDFSAETVIKLFMEIGQKNYLWRSDKKNDYPPAILVPVLLLLSPIPLRQSRRRQNLGTKTKYLS